jgi:hypothetical protein
MERTKVINHYSDINISKYQPYLRDGVNIDKDDIMIPNDIFDRINRMKLQADIHKPLVFCFYVTLLVSNSFRNKDDFLNDKANNASEMLISNSQLKELWSYSADNKKIDYIVKKNGEMDNVGLTENLKGGYRHIKYRASFQKGKFFKIPQMLLFYFIDNEELDTVAFAIYCLIKMKIQTTQTEQTGLKIPVGYFKSMFDLANDTIINAYKKLERHNLIGIEYGNIIDGYGDFIQHDENKYRITQLKFTKNVNFEQPDLESEDRKALIEAIRKALLDYERNISWETITKQIDKYLEMGYSYQDQLDTMRYMITKDSNFWGYGRTEKFFDIAIAYQKKVEELEKAQQAKQQEAVPKKRNLRVTSKPEFLI